MMWNIWYEPCQLGPICFTAPFPRTRASGTPGFVQISNYHSTLFGLGNFQSIPNIFDRIAISEQLFRVKMQALRASQNIALHGQDWQHPILFEHFKHIVQIRVQILHGRELGKNIVPCAGCSAALCTVPQVWQPPSWICLFSVRIEISFL